MYVRSLAPVGCRDRQDAVVDQLRDLRRRGRIDDVDLTVWGDSVCLEGPNARVGAGRQIVDRIITFRRWCEDADVSIDPFFEDATVDSSVTDECFRRIVPPMMCLAIYAGEELAAIYPCVEDGETLSVEEGLTALERPEAESELRTMSSG